MVNRRNKRSDAPVRPKTTLKKGRSPFSAKSVWIDSGSAWVGESVRGAERYLVSLLPSATAATTGGVLGFRRK